MILSFKKELNGEPTHFETKILMHLGEDARAYGFTPKKLTIRDDPNNRWSAGRKIHFATGARTKQYECFAEGKCEGIGFVTIQWRGEMEANPAKIDPNSQVYPISVPGRDKPNIYTLWINTNPKEIEAAYASMIKKIGWAQLFEGFTRLSYEDATVLAKDDGFESLDDFVNFHSKSNPYNSTFTKKIIYF